MGLLSNRGPPSWHPAPPEIKAVCQEAADICQAQQVELGAFQICFEGKLFGLGTLFRDCSLSLLPFVGRLAMHFTLDQEAIATTLVSTASLDRLQENIDAVYTPLTEKEKQLSQQLMQQCFRSDGRDRSLP